MSLMADRCLDVTAASAHAITLHDQFYPGKQLPFCGLRGAAAGDLAGFGAAIDFHERSIATCLNVLRELGRQRRSGGYHPL